MITIIVARLIIVIVHITASRWRWTTTISVSHVVTAIAPTLITSTLAFGHAAFLAIDVRVVIAVVRTVAIARFHLSLHLIEFFLFALEDILLVLELLPQLGQVTLFVIAEYTVTLHAFGLFFGDFSRHTNRSQLIHAIELV